MADKVIGFQIKIEGSQKVLSTIKELEKFVRDTNKALKEAEVGSEEYDRLNNQLVQAKTQLKEVRREQSAQVRAAQQTARAAKEAAGSYDQLNEQLKASRRAFKQLSQEEREGQAGQQLLQTIQKLDTELKDLDKTIGQNQRNVGNYQSAFEGVGGAIQGGISGIAGFAFGAAGLGAAGDIIIDATQQLAELTEEFRVLRGSVEQLTGATGTELDEFTSRINAIAVTFGQETDEVLRASNALSKQLGIEFTEALTAVEEGFISGANANNEFLDSITEYSSQVKAAGLTQQEFISILNLSAEQGVFSDKGIDTVKEFGLRIREQTTATRDALTGAFGEKFTDDLFNNINSGAITTADALKTVAGELNNTQIPANQLQTVITDVFGGPGEDVGLQFIQSLENINDEFEDLAGSSSEYAIQQRRILKLNKQLSESQNALTKELQGGTDAFTELSLTVQSTATNAFTSFVQNGKFVISSIVDIFSGIGDLIRRIPFLGAAFSAVVDNLKGLVVAFSSLRELAGRVSDTFAGVRAAAAAFSENTADRFRRLSIAAEIAGKRIQLGLTLNKKRRDEINRELEALQTEQTQLAQKTGEDVGNAFNLGFENALRERRATEEAAAKESEKIQKELADKLKKPIIDVNKDVSDSNKKTKKEEVEQVKRINREIVGLIETRVNDESLIQIDSEKKTQEGKVEEIKKANDKIIEANADRRAADLAQEREFQRQRQQAAFEAAQTISNAAFEIATIKAEQEKDRELQILDEQEAAELARFEGQEQKQEQIQQQFDQKREQLEQAASKKAKQRAITQAVINGALAVTNALATVQPLVPAGVLAAALVGVSTAAQIATIQAQKFARGGMIGGNSHANGGTMIEAERGEAIINKRSTAAFGPLLSAINEAGGGVRFQNGGIAGAPLPLPRISSAQNDFVGLINAIRQDVNATKQLALSVEQSVINLKVNLNTDELASEETKQVQLNNIRTL